MKIGTVFGMIGLALLVSAPAIAGSDLAPPPANIPMTPVEFIVIWGLVVLLVLLTGIVLFVLLGGLPPYRRQEPMSDYDPKLKYGGKNKCAMPHPMYFSDH